jgi:hypothetical protein
MDPKDLVTQFMGKGWKTYAAGVGMVLWAGAGVYLGVHGPDTAAGFFTGGLALIGVRHKMEDLAMPKEVVEQLKRQGAVVTDSPKVP